MISRHFVDLVLDWRTWAAIAIFVMLPPALLRTMARVFPPGDERRRELIGELYRVPFLLRSFWVFEQIEVLIAEGVPARWHAFSAWRERRKQGDGHIYKGGGLGLEARLALGLDPFGGLGHDPRTWPPAAEIRELTSHLRLRLGDIAHAHFAVLTQSPGLLDDGRRTHLPIVEEAGLAFRHSGRWYLTDVGRRAARLLTAEGPPPEGIDLKELDEILALDREWVQRELTES